MPLLSYRVQLVRNYADLPPLHRAGSAEIKKVIDRVRRTFGIDPAPISSMTHPERDRFFGAGKIFTGSWGANPYTCVVDLGNASLLVMGKNRLHIFAVGDDLI